MLAKFSDAEERLYALLLLVPQVAKKYSIFVMIFMAIGCRNDSFLSFSLSVIILLSSSSPRVG